MGNIYLGGNVPQQLSVNNKESAIYIEGKNIYPILTYAIIESGSTFSDNSNYLKVDGSNKMKYYGKVQTYKNGKIFGNPELCYGTIFIKNRDKDEDIYYGFIGHGTTEIHGSIKDYKSVHSAVTASYYTVFNMSKYGMEDITGKTTTVTVEANVMTPKAELQKIGLYTGTSASDYITEGMTYNFPASGDSGKTFYLYTEFKEWEQYTAKPSERVNSHLEIQNIYDKVEPTRISGIYGVDWYRVVNTNKLNVDEILTLKNRQVSSYNNFTIEFKHPNMYLPTYTNFKITQSGYGISVNKKQWMLNSAESGVTTVTYTYGKNTASDIPSLNLGLIINYWSGSDWCNASINTTNKTYTITALTNYGTARECHVSLVDKNDNDYIFATTIVDQDARVFELISSSNIIISNTQTRVVSSFIYNSDLKGSSKLSERQKFTYEPTSASTTWLKSISSSTGGEIIIWDHPEQGLNYNTTGTCTWVGSENLDLPHLGTDESYGRKQILKINHEGSDSLIATVIQDGPVVINTAYTSGCVITPPEYFKNNVSDIRINDMDFNLMLETEWGSINDLDRDKIKMRLLTTGINTYINMTDLQPPSKLIGFEFNSEICYEILGKIPQKGDQVECRIFFLKDYSNMDSKQTFIYKLYDGSIYKPTLWYTYIFRFTNAIES